MIASLAWLLEAILETSGAYFAFRRRLKVLSALLAWRAFADLLTFLIGLRWGGDAYGVALWICLAIQYALLYALGIQLAAKMIQDYRPLTQYVYKIWAIGASVCAYVFVTTELFEHKLARAEAVTSLLLLAVVLLGWIGRKKGLEEPWKMITLGLVFSGCGNAACSALSSLHPLGLKLYPIPAILALLIWNLATLYRKKEPMRLEIPRKFEPSSVMIHRESRFVQ